MKAWHLVFSRPRQEQRAFSNLSRQGYTVYFPRIRRKKMNGQIGPIEPTFPRYLFIRLSDRTDNWSYIRSTRGVVGLVRFGTYYAKVPDSLIAALQENEDEQGIREFYEPVLEPGDPVRIADGPLEGYEAIFHATAGKDRVRLLLDVAGSRALLEMSASHIERATHAGTR